MSVAFRTVPLFGRSLCSGFVYSLFQIAPGSGHVNSSLVPLSSALIGEPEATVWDLAEAAAGTDHSRSPKNLAAI